MVFFRRFVLQDDIEIAGIIHRRHYVGQVWLCHAADVKQFLSKKKAPMPNGQFNELTMADI